MSREKEVGADDCRHMILQDRQGTLLHLWDDGVHCLHKAFRGCRNMWVLEYSGNVSLAGYTVDNKRCFVRTRPATSMEEGSGEKQSYLLWDAEREIGMIECFPDGNALRWIKRQESLDKVQEVSINDVSWRDNILTEKVR